MEVASGPAAGRSVNFQKYVCTDETTVSRYTRYKKKKSTYHAENPHGLVCKLVAEENGTSDVLDSMLSGGF
jgi:hypothetical protein